MQDTGDILVDNHGCVDNGLPFNVVSAGLKPGLNSFSASRY